ncbi:MAG: anthranilate synthase component I [Fimbriimonadaceae bacterium]|nr:anthranilate synthase component I [Fimbriimonadaceae bacterium]
MQSPSKDEFFRRAALGKPVRIARDVLADLETPLSAYWKLASDETFSFLLESVTGGEQLARYSILGVRPRLVLRTKDRTVRRITSRGETRETLSEGQDPLHVLAEAMGPEPLEDSAIPKFGGGAVGMLGFDLVRFFEQLPDAPEDDLPIDEMAMMLCDTVVVFDHAKNLIRIIVTASPSSDGYEAACAEIERVLARLKRPLPDLPNSKRTIEPVESNMSRESYEASVRRAIEYIGAGDCFQVVLSQRFATRVQAHPLSVYRALRSLNPSPYMFLLRFGDFDVVGASPEILVSLTGRTARVRPIAGTRPRGSDPHEDEALGRELLADEKERSEHIMLVDLGRNDLGRVAQIGSVQVNDLMAVERYSHVMHIVSDVTATLADGKDAFDLLRAAYPAGTVSGAPKVRAMQIIDELEPTRRGVYAGAVGYVAASGDMDMCIAIRTICIKDGVAYVQAGAGIVFDSVPEREHGECRNKAAACLRAIEMAQTGLE